MWSGRQPRVVIGAVLLSLLMPACSDEDQGSQGRPNADTPPGEVIVGEGSTTCREASEDPVFDPQPELAYMDETASAGVCYIGFTMDSEVVKVFRLDTTECSADFEFFMPFRHTNSGWALHPDTAEAVETAPDGFCGS